MWYILSLLFLDLEWQFQVPVSMAVMTINFSMSNSDIHYIRLFFFILCFFTTRIPRPGDCEDNKYLTAIKSFLSPGYEFLMVIFENSSRCILCISLYLSFSHHTWHLIIIIKIKTTRFFPPSSCRKSLNCELINFVICFFSSVQLWYLYCLKSYTTQDQNSPHIILY